MNAYDFLMPFAQLFVICECVGAVVSLTALVAYRAVGGR